MQVSEGVGVVGWGREGEGYQGGCGGGCGYGEEMEAWCRGGAIVEGGGKALNDGNVSMKTRIRGLLIDVLYNM